VTVSSKPVVLGSISGPFTLVCPGCGGDYLHQRAVTAYNRDEDAKHTRVTVVAETGFSDHIVRSERCDNPSSRRDGIAITFTCENCHEGGSDDGPAFFDTPLELTIAQHKGHTEFAWRLAKG
jgi:hypothetical protein